MKERGQVLNLVPADPELPLAAAVGRDPRVDRLVHVVPGDRAKVLPGHVRAHPREIATPDFGEQPKVINGFSDLMVEVFGESGKGARSAVGMGALPSGIAVEIEAIFQVKD